MESYRDQEKKGEELLERMITMFRIFVESPEHQETIGSDENARQMYNKLVGLLNFSSALYQPSRKRMDGYLKNMAFHEPKQGPVERLSKENQEFLIQRNIGYDDFNRKGVLDLLMDITQRLNDIFKKKMEEEKSAEQDELFKSKVSKLNNAKQKVKKSAGKLQDEEVSHKSTGIFKKIIGPVTVELVRALVKHERNLVLFHFLLDQNENGNSLMHTQVLYSHFNTENDKMLYLKYKKKMLNLNNTIVKICKYKAKLLTDYKNENEQLLVQCAEKKDELLKGLVDVHVLALRGKVETLGTKKSTLVKDSDAYDKVIQANLTKLDGIKALEIPKASPGKICEYLQETVDSTSVPNENDQNRISCVIQLIKAIDDPRQEIQSSIVKINKQITEIEEFCDGNPDPASIREFSQKQCLKLKDTEKEKIEGLDKKAEEYNECLKLLKSKVIVKRKEVVSENHKKADFQNN